MSLGNNIAYLRKQKKLTQEQFAEQMNVTRQTVSRWESNEIIPELSKLVGMTKLFSCKLDALVLEELSDRNGIYSDVRIKKVPAFRMACYAVVSQDPENDAKEHMRQWAEKSGISLTNPEAKLIGWDFPFVSSEQQNRFGMHGYTSAVILPEGLKADQPGVQRAHIMENEEADYAVITIREPFVQPFERIPNAYKKIMDFLHANNFREKPRDRVIGCFEYEYSRGGIEYMDVYMHADGVILSDAFSGVLH